MFGFQSHFHTGAHLYFCDGYGKTGKPRVEKDFLGFANKLYHNKGVLKIVD
jgi:hypothetical protein